MTNIQEILSKFKNGEELYLNNPLFNNCVNQLLSGRDSLLILEEVIRLYSRLQYEYTKLAEQKSYPSRIIVTQEQYNNIEKEVNNG